VAVVKFQIDHPNCHFHRFLWPESKTDGILFWVFLHLLAPLLLLYVGLRHKVTHTFAFGVNYGLFLQPISRIRNIPLTIFCRANHIMSHEIKGAPLWLLKIERMIERLALNGASVYCVSETLTDQIKGRNRNVRWKLIETLPNDIQKSRREYKPDSSFRLACVGILEPRKNQELLINVIKRVDRDRVRLDLYGIGPDEARLKELIDKLDVTERVKLHGWRESSEIWPQVDLLLMPSRHEGVPNAILEAIGAGVPVVASKIPEHQEFLHPMQLVEGFDASCWVNALSEILSAKAEKLSAILDVQEDTLKKLTFDWDTEICKLIIPKNSTLEFVLS
jgi:glycosyltransferase involved in cell wall biosynthesis